MATKSTLAHAALEVPRDTVSPNSELAIMNNEVQSYLTRGHKKVTANLFVIVVIQKVIPCMFAMRFYVVTYGVVIMWLKFAQM